MAKRKVSFRLQISTLVLIPLIAFIGITTIYLSNKYVTYKKYEQVGNHMDIISAASQLVK